MFANSSQQESKMQKYRYSFVEGATHCGAVFDADPGAGGSYSAGPGGQGCELFQLESGFGWSELPCMASHARRARTPVDLAESASQRQPEPGWFRCRGNSCKRKWKTNPRRKIDQRL
jgi:hypothetical protein